MNRRKITHQAKALGALVAVSLLGCTLRSSQDQSGVASAPQQPSALASASIDPPIVFASISGLPPQYIDAGPQKGLGWREYETLQVRKGLKSDGIRLVQEWMTPSRITHEFHERSPICTYPVEWMNPSETFSSTTSKSQSSKDFRDLRMIYSIPLNLGGLEGISIIFNKEDFSRFKPHLLPNGNLDIHSLINDHALKTLLIRDKDYGQFTKIFTTTSETGEQIVRPEFAENIELRVIRDNRQIVEMLKARRFDYTFSQIIEDQDLKDSKIAADELMRLTFKTPRIKDEKDPNLVLVSIGCSDHPLSRKAMPWINKWIEASRGTGWVKATMAYRNQLDPGFQGDYIASTVFRFGAKLLSGTFDQWYPQQQKLYPGLALFPAPTSIQKFEVRAEAQLPLRWAAVRDCQDCLTVFNESETSLAVPMRAGSTGQTILAPYVHGNIAGTLSASQLGEIQSKAALSGSSPTRFEDLKLDRFGQVRKLTVFAAGLGSEVVRELIPFLASRSLEEVSLFGLGQEESRLLIPYLPKTLRSLNLTSSSLSLSKIEEVIAGMPLVSLHLNDSQITERQLDTLLMHLPSSVEHLSLGFLRASWGGKAPLTFGQRMPPGLKTLDLEASSLYDGQLRLFAQALPRTLQSLKLGYNRLTPHSLVPLFQKEFPSLVELDLSENSIHPKFIGTLKIPESVKSLSLQVCELTPESLRKIQLPKQIESLDVHGNALGDEGVMRFLEHLGSQVDLLNLSKTELSQKAIRALVENRQVKKVNTLVLQLNRLTDQEALLLSEAKFKLGFLDLKSNRVMNAGAEKLAERIIPNLIGLDLSDNPIAEHGVQEVSKALPSKLRILKLSSLLSLDLEALVPHIPKGLEVLDLSGNMLSDSDLRLLAPSLPDSLRALDLSLSNFSAAGFLSLSQHLPQGLHALSLGSVPLDDSSALLLASSLPRGLRSLSLGKGRLTKESMSRLSTRLPASLEILRMKGIRVEGDDFSSLFQSLPISLRILQVAGAPIAAESLKSVRWPQALKTLDLNAAKVGDSGAVQLAQSLPGTLERLILEDNDLGDVALGAIAKRPLDHVFGFWIAGNRFTYRGLKALLLSARGCPHYLFAGILGFKELPRKEFTPELLKNVRLLHTSSLQVPPKDLIALIANLPEDFWTLEPTSMGLRLEHVADLIRALPKNLQNLDVAGNEIGEKGLVLLTEHQRKLGQKGHALSVTGK